MSKFIEYVEMLRLISWKNLVETLLWYIGINSSVEIRVGDSVLRLSTRISITKIIWYLKVLSKAHRLGIHVIADNESIKIKYDKVSLTEPLNDYSFMKLYYIALLRKNGFKVYNNKIIKPGVIELRYPSYDPFAPPVVAETFIGHEYGFLNVKDRVVIDVGAYIGDSAIYFVRKGAKKVICFEPHPLLFRYLVENVKLNGYEDRIKCHNYGVSSDEDVASLIVPEEVLLATSRVSRSIGDTHVLKIKTVKLPLEGDVLKMDCEGCEYEVLLNIEPRDLPFQEIGLEYHGSPKPLIKHLRRGGYKVRIMKRDLKRGTGLLYAYKKNN